MSNEACGFLCPVCGSAGPHAIIGFGRDDDGFVTELRLYCLADEASWTEPL